VGSILNLARILTAALLPPNVSTATNLLENCIANGERVLGFDNAHPVRRAAGPGARKRPEHDHRHWLQSVRSYDYQDAGTLLADFWAEEEAFLKERGMRS
jgi:hypothetical protein